MRPGDEGRDHERGGVSQRGAGPGRHVSVSKHRRRIRGGHRGGGGGGGRVRPADRTRRLRRPPGHDEGAGAARVPDGDVPADAQGQAAVSAAGADAPINLRLITTDLSFSRPVPLPSPEKTYLFRREDMAKLFPPTVVDHLWRTGPPADELGPVLGDAVDQYRYVPAEDLPVVVAFRL